MRKTVTILGTLVLVAAIALPVFAYHRGSAKRGGMAMGPAGMQAPFCHNVPNLTPEQSAKLTELRVQHDKNVLPLRNELTAKHAEFRNLWLQANPDQAAIKAKQQEMNDLRDKLQDSMTEHRLEVGKILTPEQKAQLQSSRPGWDRRSPAKRPGSRGHGPMRTW